MHIEIIICTHNRKALLQRVLNTLCGAQVPQRCGVSIHVVANACTDDTYNFLDKRIAHRHEHDCIHMRWSIEEMQGKSYALNRALSDMKGDVVAFVDDDHRVPPDFISSICEAVCAYPDIDLFCGRILPDWDGSEPDWAHEKGQYAIYPLPVPHYDFGREIREVPEDARLPGGGNIVVRKRVFESVKGFSTDLGPQGHDLGGGEDIDFVRRVLKSGFKLMYYPDIAQYHFVDTTRFKFRYILIKAFQRSRSVTRVSQGGENGVPLYLWRKLARYGVNTIFSLKWQKTRFYSVRVAATLGEIYGFRDAENEMHDQD